MNDERVRSDRELLARIAYRFYMADRTQEELARDFHMSRSKVQRLLKRARQTGIVDTRIIAPPGLNLALESRLRAAFRLEDAIVTPDQPDEQSQRQTVARAAAEYLERSLSAGAVVAVGMGRNTGEIARFYRPTRPLDCTFVSAMGGSPGVAGPTNPNEICRALAERSGGRAESLYAPAYVESQEIRDQLRQQAAVVHSLQIAAAADVALVGVGGTDDECTMVRSGCCPLGEMARFRAQGAVGDVLGNYFDVTGQMISSDLNRRLIGLTLDDLRRIDTVIAVVSEGDKSASVLGALRTGVLDVLIVDEANATALLEAIPAIPTYRTSERTGEAREREA